MFQERTGNNSYTHESLTLKYKLDNEFELIFMVSSFFPIFCHLYLYKYENVCLSWFVCLFAHIFLGHFETDLDTLGTKFLLGGTRSPSGTRGRSLGRRQGRSRGVSWRRSRSRSRGVGERFKPIVDFIDTIKLARLYNIYKIHKCLLNIFIKLGSVM